MCHIHNCKFTYPENIPDEYVECCPLCLQDENKLLRNRVEEVTKHLKLLLDVVELKQAISIMN